MSDKPVYITTKLFTTPADKKENGWVEVQIESTKADVITVKFHFNDKDHWKHGTGQYGPWALVGDIEVFSEKCPSLKIEKTGLFAKYDFEKKDKVVGGRIKLYAGIFLDIYFGREDGTYSLYLKEDPALDPLYNTKNNPF